MGSSPQVVDWNSDGLLDIVSGDRNGNINLFISDTSGLVAYYRARIMVNGDSLNVGTNSEPTVIDWNCDGKKDLLVGCEAGYIYVYLNQNTDAAVPGLHDADVQRQSDCDEPHQPHGL
jgi:hypothetical protein